jgi:hypothetical protein
MKSLRIGKILYSKYIPTLSVMAILPLCVTQHCIAGYDGFLINFNFPQEISYTPGSLINPKVTFTVKNTGDQTWTSCEISYPTKVIPAYKIELTNLSWNPRYTSSYYLMGSIEPGLSNSDEWELGENFLPTEPGDYSFKMESYFHSTNQCQDDYALMKGNNPATIHFTLSLKPQIKSMPWIPLLLLDKTETDWITIMDENFENSFPTGAWTLLGNPTWGTDDYNPSGGTKCAWCAKSGTLGIEPETKNYANQMNSWMIYGPFDLSDAHDAKLVFSFWLNSENGHDYFKWLASIDGTNFNGWQKTGKTNGWAIETFDLKAVPNIGTLCGKSEVWIAFYFVSDSSGTSDGAFIDNILLLKN